MQISLPSFYPTVPVLVVVVVVLPYLLLLRGLRLEKIFLFNLFMNEMAALRWA